MFLKLKKTKTKPLTGSLHGFAIILLAELIKVTLDSFNESQNFTGSIIDTFCQILKKQIYM